jgi:small-conductance mechanosensitive channel
MSILTFLRDRLMADALLPNLIAAAALAVAVQVPSWALRRLLRTCGGRVAGWTGSRRLGAVGQEAAGQVEAVLFWLTLAAVVMIAAAGISYHLAGRDVRGDFASVWSLLTVEDLVQAGLRVAGLAGLLTALWVTIRRLRKLRPRFEGWAAPWLERAANQGELRRALTLLERFAVVGAWLVAAWSAGHLLALPAVADAVITLAGRLTLLLAAVRLLPLVSRLVLGSTADLGDRHLGQGRLRHYWASVRRLAPFGQRCFECAVYVYAGSLAVRALHFLGGVAAHGPRVVACIGVFFGCRVVIELSQVLLNEAFGLYDEHRPADQKGQTLVPLLHSVGQYLLYFGSGVVMLGVLGVNTAPILAGAGLLGLVVGLGSQSLVTDVVSGFFILFEGQYLVGDYVEIGGAVGRVEAISIRNTEIRDALGKLHLIPNGQIKEVVNSSKGYVNAVVEVKRPADGDLDRLLEAMRETGRRLRREHPDRVLADTEVAGPITLAADELTARAVTRVRPGMNEAMENEYRRLLKQVLAEQAAPATTRTAA